MGLRALILILVAALSASCASVRAVVVENAHLASAQPLTILLLAPTPAAELVPWAWAEPAERIQSGGASAAGLAPGLLSLDVAEGIQGELRDDGYDDLGLDLSGVEYASAKCLQGWTYANANPTRFSDPDGRSATAMGATAGFFWGFGQMAGGLIDDVGHGRVGRDWLDALGVWGQNIVAGAEMGAAIDIGLASGGLAASASGALFNAGFGALTVKGKEQEASDFAVNQMVDVSIGGLAGPVLAKAAPAVGGVARAAARLPGVSVVVDVLASVGSSAAERFTGTAFGKWATTYAHAADQILPAEEVVSSSPLRGLLAETGEESARVVAARAKAAAAAAGIGPGATIEAGLRPRNFGLETIADNPALQREWMEAVKGAATGTNAYSKYLTAMGAGEQMSNRELGAAFSTVRSAFADRLEKQGMSLAPGVQVHHWNYNKADFALSIVDPRHLVVAPNRAMHETLHAMTNSLPPGAVRFWPFNGRIAPVHEIPIGNPSSPVP